MVEEVLLEKDSKYYFELVVLRVENCLFSVPRHRFERESRIFQDMFKMPAVGVPDGLSDSKPIFLEGISKEKFRHFIEFLYPKSFFVNDPDDPEPNTRTLEEWEDILSLATMWDMPRIRKGAILTMSSMDMDPAEKIVLARCFDIDEWLLPAFERLVLREEPLGVRDLHLLGEDSALKVCALRESLSRAGNFLPGRGELRPHPNYRQHFEQRMRNDLGIGWPSPRASPVPSLVASDA
ncbi:hypothetical protein HGRIS_001930 [Hohenbuehelia grisea]|uniref:BTB domain-containing protein n=1 Tax=Hohenbuehelia grisea TaxID=104357 RepID=A0ABR3JJQ1_9AGAR